VARPIIVVMPVPEFPLAPVCQCGWMASARRSVGRGRRKSVPPVGNAKSDNNLAPTDSWRAAAPKKTTNRKSIIAS